MRFKLTAHYGQAAIITAVVDATTAIAAVTKANALAEHSSLLLIEPINDAAIPLDADCLKELSLKDGISPHVVRAANRAVRAHSFHV